MVMVFRSVVDEALTAVKVLPSLMVTPSSVAVPLFWIAPPLEFVSVPPLIVPPLSSTIEPAPVA